MTELFLTQLSKIIARSQIITDIAQQSSYIQDWRGRYNATALAVVLPHNVTELSAIVKLANQYNIGVIPQGGNTGTCGGSVVNAQLDRKQVIVNLTKLKKYYQVDTINQSINVSANHTLQEVQDIADAHNLYFPLSIASGATATVGGAIATNAGGIHVIRYGMMRNLTLGIALITSDGGYMNLLDKPIKNNTGFDLKQIYIGSEGSLGIVTEAKLRLYQPENNVISMVVTANSIEELLRLKEQLSAITTIIAYELIGNTALSIWRKFCTSSLVLDNSSWYGFIKLAINSPQDLEDIANLDNISDNTIIAEDSTQQAQIWQIREEIPLAEKQYGITAKHDISVDLACMTEFIQQSQQKIQAEFPDSYICLFGHLGDGNLHYNVGFTHNSKVQILEHESHINQMVYTLIKHYNGSIAAEHGIGQLKVHDFARYFSQEYQQQQLIKQALDPHNILNPGKVVEI